MSDESHQHLHSPDMVEKRYYLYYMIKGMNINVSFKTIQWNLKMCLNAISILMPSIYRYEQGSLWRAIRAKKSPCEGWLRFLVGQTRSSSRLVILKSRRLHIFSTCHLWKCQYRARVYWNLSYPLLSILKVIFLESNPWRFIETLISFIRGFVYYLYMPGLK